MINLVDEAKMEGKPKKKKWMKKAFANAHGQFKAKAEAAGESTKEFAHEHEHDSGKLGKQARLAEVGMASHKKHSKVKALYGKKEGKYYHG